MEKMILNLLKEQIKNRGISGGDFQKLSKEEKESLEKKGEKYFLKEEIRRKIKVVLTGGVFDVLHIGHILTLNEAKTKGDFLVVAIASDEHIRKKGREPIHTQEYRRIIIESIKSVDLAVAGFSDPKEMIEVVKPDIIVYGYDQKEFLKPDGIEVIKLEKKYDDSKFKSGKILERLGV
jgi:cytidyltransferase-like protein